MNPTLLRTSALAILAAANTVAGSRVDDSRLVPMGENETFPRINLFTARCRAAQISAGGGAPTLRRSEELTIECWSRAADDAATAAALDTLESQVLSALLTNAAWVKQFERIEDVDIQRGRDADSDDRRGLTRIVIPVRYNAKYPPALEDALDTIRIETDIIPASGAPDGTIEVTSEVAL